ncbi:type II toxin-antitoxin system VapC family toxin [Nitrospirillum viridazoti]|uniref:PIN domain-containing protein n=1 Tax=Nitrospirillum amazonense TaxID=28077 RepID=A0A560IZ96_9PROT|nr:PIN domain-containing protein [Nitrospirillum amazonense]TWB63795.1 PIN domain-containing protein [Nitrospirillum amazonense]
MLAAQRLYVDANIIIYFVEAGGALQQKATEVFSHARANHISLITSEITVGECLVGAHKTENQSLVDGYRQLFHELDVFQLMPVKLQTIEIAARMGAGYQMKLMDARCTSQPPLRRHAMYS